MRVKVTILVEKEVFERARKIGLSISRVAENALVDLMSRIEQEDLQRREKSSNK